jgi:SAM-dependent methyltransferase
MSFLCGVPQVLDSLSEIEFAIVDLMHTTGESAAKVSDLHAGLYRAFDSDPGHIIKFLKWLGTSYQLRSPVRLLDVGCGPGRLLRPLAEAGWTVTGMEPNEGFREAAQQAVADFGIEVIPGGFNDIDAEAEFDMIVGINGSFAYILSSADRQDALQRCHRALAAGGVLFLDLPNLLRILFEYRGSGQFEAEMGEYQVHLERRHEVDFHAAVFTTHEEYTLIREGQPAGTFEAVHPYAILPYPALEEAAKAAGFVDIRTFTRFESRSVERIGPNRMMMAARRAGGRGPGT